MEKVRVRISEMPNRCKLVVESSRRARYNNVEEEIEYFGVSLKALAGSIKCHFIGHHFIAQIGLTSFLIRMNKVR